MRWTLLAGFAFAAVAAAPAFAQAPVNPTEPGPGIAPPLRARVVAVGIPGISAVAEIGAFHPGGPIHDNPAFAEYTKAGNILDAKRVLVTSTSNFGAPRVRPQDAEGSVLSLDPSDPAPIVVSPDFASAGDQASAVNGRLKLFAAQSPRFLNRVNAPQAATADLAAVSNPLGISINNAFGRLWFPSAPAGSVGGGFDSILDPGGQPLAGAPSKLAGGVFAGDQTNRAQQIVPGGLRSGAIGNAFLGASSDGSKRAVFAVVTADGAVVQAHTEHNIDGLAPAATIGPIALQTGTLADPKSMATRAGVIFNWVPNRILYITDPMRDAIAVLLLADDGKVFQVKDTTRISSPRLRTPVDIAPAISEIANPGFASNTTLAAESDFYVLNRGDGTIVRMRQNGTVVAARTVVGPSGAPLGPGQVNGIAVSRDAAKLWVTISGALPEQPGSPGALLEVPAFGADRAGSLTAPEKQGASLIERGARHFGAVFGPAEGLGPLFNGRSCATCHAEPVVGGMGPGGLASVLRVGRLGTEGFDPLIGKGGPVSRAHSVAELGIPCSVPSGIPAEANLVSLRNTPALFGAGLIDALPEAAIWPNEPAAGARGGRPNWVVDAQGQWRIGRFGWKADVATLEEFVGLAFRNELGITNPLAPTDLASVSAPNCGATAVSAPEDDGRLVREVAAYVASLPRPRAGAEAAPYASEGAGRALFAELGCASCHKPELHLGSGEKLALYSDLLLHDMGARLDDGVLQGQARGRDWRTTPLWGLGNRSRFLHDGSAESLTAAVLAHDGEATDSVRKFSGISSDQRGVLLGFLQAL